jgi:uncharacterized protein YegP (UPF0339 family)
MITTKQSEADGLWYWHLKSANGKVVADGAEGYASRGNARRAARRAKALMATAVIEG